MYMTEIEILQEVSSKVPDFCLGVLEMKVVVEPSGEALLELIKGRVAELEGSMSVEAITDYKAINGKLISDSSSFGKKIPVTHKAKTFILMAADNNIIRAVLS